MNNEGLNSIIRFVLFLILQVLVLNHFNLFGYINPMVYIIWVLLYPIKKSKTILLIFSFLLGLCIDFFSDSGGINAAATLFIAYIRLPILNIVLGKSDFDHVLFNLRNIPIIKAIAYITLITLIHHFIIFGLEYYSINAIFTILSNTFITGFFTVLLIVLGMILFTNKK